MGIINEESRFRLESLSEHVIEYIDTRWDLMLLTLTEKGISALSSLIIGMLTALFGSIAVVFAGIGTAIWLGQILNNPAVGYFIMAGVFLVMLGGALLFAQTYLRTSITNVVLDSIKDNDENDETQSKNIS